jgi:SAM-dependent methyltransferase
MSSDRRNSPGNADYREKYVRKDEARLRVPTPFEQVASRFDSTLLQTHLPPGNIVLDIGCNKGFLLAALPHHRTVGMDLAFGFRATGPAYVIGDAEALPFRNGSFDGAVMAEVVEHLPNCDASYREIRRVLRDGGLFLLTHPNKDNPLQRALEAVKENRWVRRALGRSLYSGAQHMREYSFGDSKSSLAALGMTLLERYTPSLGLTRLLSPLVYGRFRCERLFPLITRLGHWEEKVALAVGKFSSLLPTGYTMLFQKRGEGP